MPFGKWANFESCVKSIMGSKGFSRKRASAYCATIMRKVEGENTNYSKGAIEEAHKKISK